MERFISTEYNAYFFVEDTDNGLDKNKDSNGEILGYALVKNSCSPLYLRQFFIKRDHRIKYFEHLLRHRNLENLPEYLLPEGYRFVFY